MLWPRLALGRARRHQTQISKSGNGCNHLIKLCNNAVGVILLQTRCAVCIAAGCGLPCGVRWQGYAARRIPAASSSTVSTPQRQSSCNHILHEIPPAESNSTPCPAPLPAGKLTRWQQRQHHHPAAAAAVSVATVGEEEEAAQEAVVKQQATSTLPVVVIGVRTGWHMVAQVQ